MATIYTKARALANRHGVPIDNAQRAVIARLAAQRAHSKRDRERLEREARALLTA